LERERDKLIPSNKPKLTVDRILSLTDSHYFRYGVYPNRGAGVASARLGETWAGIDAALRNGRRGLPGGWSLAKRLHEHRGLRNGANLPPYTAGQILAWADAHYARHGEYPTRKSGKIPEAPGETWSAVETALYKGTRGLPGGSTLKQLLAQERGVRNPRGLPPLSTQQILSWADAHYCRHGAYPTIKSGPVEDAPGENWFRISDSLRLGLRGVPRGYLLEHGADAPPPSGSLLQLLIAEGRLRSKGKLGPKAPRQSCRVRKPLTEDLILKWADAYYRRHGKWPKHMSGPIPEATSLQEPGQTGVTWASVHTALYLGQRGLPGGDSLARLLKRQRGARNHRDLPRLTIEQILSWADAYRKQHGRYPNGKTRGPIVDAPQGYQLEHGSRADAPLPAHHGADAPPQPETWHGINAALRSGFRGLPAGNSLARLLDEHRPERIRLPLDEATILRWADSYFARHGDWPRATSGDIAGSGGHTWASVDSALQRGRGGLTGGESLVRFLARHRGRRNLHDQPRFNMEQIEAWMRAHRQRHGRFPVRASGPIPEAPGETWSAVYAAMRKCNRGLPGGETLATVSKRLEMEDERESGANDL
jgi:hypothetical protein